MPPASWKPSCSGGELDFAGKKIVEAKTAPAIELTQQNFRRSVARVIAACAIKQLPDELMTGLCFNLYVKKYAAHIPLAEFDLAFELNLTADLAEKVNHYQVFSAEFMCQVLNLYMQKRRQANVALNRMQSAQPVIHTLPTGDTRNQLLQQLSEDYLQYHSTGHTDFVKGFTPKAKLQALVQLFEVDSSEENLSNLQQQAMQNILRQLRQERLTLRGQKFGRMIELERTITRFKTGTGLTPADHARLHSETRRLQIIQIFNTYPAAVFLGWLGENEGE